MLCMKYSMLITRGGNITRGTAKRCILSNGEQHACYVVEQLAVCIVLYNYHINH